MSEIGTEAWFTDQTKDLPVIFATPFELLRVAEGHPMVMATQDGTRILLRLPTVDEAVAGQAAAAASIGHADMPGPARSLIEDMVRPLVLP